MTQGREGVGAIPGVEVTPRGDGVLSTVGGRAVTPGDNDSDDGSDDSDGDNDDNDESSHTWR